MRCGMDEVYKKYYKCNTHGFCHDKQILILHTFHHYKRVIVNIL
ncbi:11907_t:CDS:2 [Ambispora leptoticha]|uniref:11907_t:CDS:1 n=1 Tax=Ambispora leptoticha TaxID=144679 RepID=A0A9N8ZGY2_9GLOM|nr:11907_t:CDS:2 [Ambispora leptoticha]